MTSRTINTCRACGSQDLRRFLDLGDLPLSDGLRRAEQLAAAEPHYPLRVVFCGECSLVQITEEVEPATLFGSDYPYHSSFSDDLLRHSEQNVRHLIGWRGIDTRSTVVEIASNDGYLLQYFRNAGVQVLGIDPAPGPARVAVERGIPTRNTFFTSALAEQLVAEGIRADVVIANNVMAHVPDLCGFVAGVACLLKDDGTTSIEAPYVRDLVAQQQFDTIYHEHLCYFSVTAVERLFRAHDLHLNRVVHLPIHGGSLRYHAGRRSEPDGSVEAFLEAERETGVDRFMFYADFGERVAALREQLREIVFTLHAQGARFAAYGAAAKGAILLNYVGLGADVVEFVVDRNVHKHGRYMPGLPIPIRAPEHLLDAMPDYTLLLPWNFEREIVSQQRAYLERGGRFLVPVPAPRIVSASDVLS
jgi:hypothetical protein